MNYSIKLVFSGVVPEAEEAKRILGERISEMAAGTDFREKELCVRFERTSGNGFQLDIGNGEIRIAAEWKIEFIAGVGRLLRLLWRAADEGGGIPGVHEVVVYCCLK